MILADGEEAPGCLASRQDPPHLVQRLLPQTVRLQYIIAIQDPIHVSRIDEFGGNATAALSTSHSGFDQERKSNNCRILMTRKRSMARARFRDMDRLKA